MTVMNKRLFYILLSIPILLLIPLIAMQFTEEVNWELGDFIIMGVLLLVVGMSIELIIRNVKKDNKRWIFILIIVLLFLLLWAEMAVGIFGSPIAGS